MKNALIRFVYWLLKKMGVMPPRPEEVKITITAEDHASPVIAAVTEKAAQMRAHLDAAEKSAEKINAMTGSAKPSAEEVAMTKPVYPETVDCETCGCMVEKKNAVKGSPEIREAVSFEVWTKNLIREISLPMAKRFHDGAVYSGSIEEHKLYYPHYCKACAPKPRAAKKPRRVV